MERLLEPPSLGNRDLEVDLKVPVAGVVPDSLGLSTALHQIRLKGAPTTHVGQGNRDANGRAIAAHRLIENLAAAVPIVRPSGGVGAPGPQEVRGARIGG